MLYTKDFARYYISYQDNLNESDKKTLLNFVNEANTDQIKTLLYTGEMVQEGPMEWLGKLLQKKVEIPSDTMHWYRQIPEPINKSAAAIKDTERSLKLLADLKKDQHYKISKHYETMMDIIKRKGLAGKEKIRAIHQANDWKAKELAKVDGRLKAMVKHVKAKAVAAKAVAAKDAVVKAATKGELARAAAPGLKQQAAVSKAAASKAAAATNLKLQTALSAAKVSTSPVGSIVLAAAIAAASYIVYKRFLSKAARSCSGKSGDVKTLCMQQFKKRATQLRIKTIQSQITKCKDSKEPEKCKAKLMSTIRHLQSKLSEI